jgi:Flp pilus assembly pilin Flp
MRRDQIGQGLVEYATSVTVVAVLMLIGLGLIGPAVGELFDTIGQQVGMTGIVTGVIIERASHGLGNAIHVTVGVTRDTVISVRNDASDETEGPILCRGSCLVILAGVGPDAGTVTVTTEAGHAASAEYGGCP